MYRVLTCLGGEHDWRLVVLGGVVCFATCLVAVGLFERVYATNRRAHSVWVITSGTATGCGIWATHFIAMLAYEPNIPVGFAAAWTAVSLLAAIAITSAGLAIASSGRSVRAAAVGGMVVGGGIATMHYLGMAALQVPGHLTWSPDLVIASILFGIIFGAAALVVAAGHRSRTQTVGAALLLTLAIVSHHFTAMGAVEIIPDPLQQADSLSLSPSLLAITIAVAAVVVLGLGVAGVIIDRRMRDQGVQLKAAMDNMRQGLMMFDAEQRLVLFNRRYAEMYRLQPETIDVGCKIRELLERQMQVGTFQGDADRYIADLLQSQDGASVTIELPDGRTIITRNQRVEGGGFVSTHEDITDRIKAEAKIRYMAHHDPLTGLLNRAAFLTQVEKSLVRLRDGNAFAVLCLDLDRFKSVNDTLGHSIGDALLQTVGRRMLGCARKSDLIARLGGDEFAVLQMDINEPEDAAALAGRIIEAVGQPFDLDGNLASIGVSVGIAIADEGSQAAQLMADADAALYCAKAERGGYCFFDAAMNEKLRARRELENDLRKALRQQEFEVYYQPFVSVQGGAIVGCEALLRWHHPQKGLVSPADFIPLAEETGLITPIGEWVLHQACKDAASWPQPIRVAVNLSAVQFKSRDLVVTIKSALTEAGLPPQRLELEITESALLIDNEATLAVLHRLRTQGIRIAMDDFGTGYSSLSYLRSFPFDKIKIDRSFIRDLGTDDDCVAIVKAVAGLGRGFGIDSTAEGVETQAQLEDIRAEGCTEIQGFFISEPCPNAVIREFIANWPMIRAVA